LRRKKIGAKLGASFLQNRLRQALGVQQVSGLADNVPPPAEVDDLTFFRNCG